MSATVENSRIAKGLRVVAVTGDGTEVVGITERVTTPVMDIVLIRREGIVGLLGIPRSRVRVLAEPGVSL